MERFCVHWYDPDGGKHTELQWVDSRTAVEQAFSLTDRPATRMGIIRRVIITDANDCCCFEWKYNEGVTFPPLGERP